MNREGAHYSYMKEEKPNPGPPKEISMVVIGQLIAKHIPLTAEEWKVVNEYRQRSPQHERALQKLHNPKWVEKQLEKMELCKVDKAHTKEMWEEMRTRLKFEPEPWYNKLKVWYWKLWDLKGWFRSFFR